VVAGTRAWDVDDGLGREGGQWRARARAWPRQAWRPMGMSRAARRVVGCGTWQRNVEALKKSNLTLNLHSLMQAAVEY
jgi:hypothetical protein